ncbi:glycosyl transferase [Mesobaculum littorinae]|uniref:Glycosyl transferase n=1 Tax=Mesobaculum littorinae TaxID=2486419 RepID=A0A438AHB6_9RHOB|nr:glycosyltransferase family 39 protein [Mesobaculum littorinae]RVV98082.1 glycosyl transferase [Mesobaculum littorinae]
MHAAHKTGPGEGLRPALAVVLGVTLLRVVVLAVNDIDLYVDEAQYWLWGQRLDFGYYSKPPLIGWVIRAVTELAGSDAVFWVRLPAPLCHGLTAVILGRAAGELAGPRAAFWAAVSYVTLPMTAVGGLLITTDTILAPFYAGALLCYLRLLRGASQRDALLAGLLLGFGFLAKYAAIYLLGTAALAAIFVPAARPGWRAAALMLVGFVLVAAPNVVWNLTHDLTTVAHTMDNIEWVRSDESAGPILHWDELGSFFLSQFGVFGPVMMGALLIAAVRGRTPVLRSLVWLSLPVVALICVQALLARAYENWAVTAYYPGLLAAVLFLLDRRRWLVASFAVNGALCLTVAVLSLFPAAVRPGGEPLLRRYIGADEMTQQILSVAVETGAGAIVADHRGILADLFYTGRDSTIPVFAPVPQGRAANYYEKHFPLPVGAYDRVLYIDRPGNLVCDGMPTPDPVAEFDTSAGAYIRTRLQAWIVAPECQDELGLNPRF